MDPISFTPGLLWLSSVLSTIGFQKGPAAYGLVLFEPGASLNAHHGLETKTTGLKSNGEDHLTSQPTHVADDISTTPSSWSVHSYAHTPSGNQHPFNILLKERTQKHSATGVSFPTMKHLKHFINSMKNSYLMSVGREQKMEKEIDPSHHYRSKQNEMWKNYKALEQSEHGAIANPKMSRKNHPSKPVVLTSVYSNLDAAAYSVHPRPPLSAKKHRMSHYKRLTFPPISPGIPASNPELDNSVKSSDGEHSKQRPSPLVTSAGGCVASSPGIMSSSQDCSGVQKEDFQEKQKRGMNSSQNPPKSSSEKTVHFKVRSNLLIPKQEEKPALPVQTHQPGENSHNTHHSSNPHPTLSPEFGKHSTQDSNNPVKVQYNSAHGVHAPNLTLTPLPSSNLLTGFDVFNHFKVRPTKYDKSELLSQISVTQEPTHKSGMQGPPNLFLSNFGSKLRQPWRIPSWKRPTIQHRPALLGSSNFWTSGHMRRRPRLRRPALPVKSPGVKSQNDYIKLKYFPKSLMAHQATDQWRSAPRPHWANG